MQRTYQICTNCVMDTSDSKITFDEHGVCDHCRTFKRDIEPVWHPDAESERKLEEIIAGIKDRGKDRKYDCMIGMSGGLDSSYLTYLAIAKYGLRPLVYNIDTGWGEPFAEENIRKITSKLGVELLVEKLDWPTMREAQLAFFRAAVPHIDTPQDHASFATIYHFASKYGISNILTGTNYSTECVRNPMEWMYYQSDSWQVRDILEKFGHGSFEKFPMTNILWHKFYLPYIKRIKVFDFLNYIPYERKKAMAELEKEFGYQTYSQKHFENIFTKFYESYWLYEKFGYDTRRVQLSSLILTGQMTRDEALEILKKPPYDPDTIEQDFNRIAEKLEITPDELRGFMKLPNKTYKDYRNQQSLYIVGSKVLHALGIVRGGKR